MSDSNDSLHCNICSSQEDQVWKLTGETIRGTAQTEMKKTLPRNAEAIKADSQDPPPSLGHFWCESTKCGQGREILVAVDRSTTRNAKLLGNRKALDCFGSTTCWFKATLRPEVNSEVRGHSRRCCSPIPRAAGRPLGSGASRPWSAAELCGARAAPAAAAAAAGR